MTTVATTADEPMAPVDAEHQTPAEYDPTSTLGWNSHSPSPGTWHVATPGGTFLRLDERHRRVDVWDRSYEDGTPRYVGQALVMPPAPALAANAAETRAFLIAHLPALVAAAPQL